MEKNIKHHKLVGIFGLISLICLLVGLAGAISLFFLNSSQSTSDILNCILYACLGTLAILIAKLSAKKNVNGKLEAILAFLFGIVFVGYIGADEIMKSKVFPIPDTIYISQIILAAIGALNVLAGIFSLIGLIICFTFKKSVPVSNQPVINTPVQPNQNAPVTNNQNNPQGSPYLQNSAPSSSNLPFFSDAISLTPHIQNTPPTPPVNQNVPVAPNTNNQPTAPIAPVTPTAPLAHGPNNPTASMEPIKDKSYFDGHMIQYLGWSLLSVIVTAISLGICYPITVSWMIKFKYKHTVYDNKRLVFDGNGAEMLGKWILWVLLSIITIGIYALWVPCKLEAWKAKHTHLKDEI